MGAAGRKKLRRGFATGACAAAAATAAWRLLAGRRPGKSLTLVFPDGKRRRLPLAGMELARNEARAWVCKEAGDDPDVTNGIVIRARVRCRRPGAPAAPEDFVLPCGSGEIVLRAGRGVGRVTRPGLEVPPGKWAINPVPRQMLVANLAAAGFGRRPAGILVEISADGGEEIGKRTLNPVLGVVGGISILGTSGIVVPYSHAAYLATIKVLLRGVAAAGGTTVVLATGGRTHKAAVRDFPALPATAFIRIGDFIAESLELAAGMGIRRVIVACMAGKLYKYAQGFPYTHAHTVSLTCDDLVRVVAGQGGSGEVLARCAASRSVREALGYLPPPLRTRVLAVVGRRAAAQISRWFAPGRGEVRLYSPAGELQAAWPLAAEEEP
ncbi:MAG: cobalt-precorrin-5B (C(1))-methyltransferase [Deltaproteobacteria bacterium]|nr:cobalt-precorrin-5B (C(1))-methyltransferase [Deltaproteobacteria bacterium]